METKSLERLLESIKGLSNEQERIHLLTRIIYDTIPEMFEGRFFDPTGVEIHYQYGITQSEGVEIHHRYGVTQRIYAWHLCENIARKLLGLEVKKAKGDSWEDAQKREKILF